VGHFESPSLEHRRPPSLERQRPVNVSRSQLPCTFSSEYVRYSRLSDYLHGGRGSRRGGGLLRRIRKDNAGAVFSKSKLAVATKASFSEAFPSVRRARIEVEETFYRRTVIHHLTEEDAGEFVDCSNPACYGGGVSIGAVLRWMVATKRSEMAEAQLCRGYEGSKRRRARDCPHSFTVRVVLDYALDDPTANLIGARSSEVLWGATSRAATAFAASRSVIDVRNEPRSAFW
jgi:hypothetical protein